MVIVKAYHNKDWHDTIATGTRSELMPIFESLVKQYDNEHFILIKEVYTEGYCYADFAHIKKGDMHGFVIALAGNVYAGMIHHKKNEDE